MGDHRLPKRIMSGMLKGAGQRARGSKEEAWAECFEDDIRVLVIGRGIGEPMHYNLGLVWHMIVTYSRVWITRLPILHVVS